ncbi:MAG: YjbH domain-containing protein [Armatimonadetes bacterium]|nr:YjbH domain-containing protein [Armatimonadota bacterium]
MKKNVLLAGLVTLVSLMATASFSAPSSIGPTGILNLPTAEVVTEGNFEMMLAYDRPKVADVGIVVFPVVTLGYGVANGEIGLSYFNVQDYTAVKGINAKYIFAHESEKSPSIAAGVMYLSGNTAETDLYLVASDRLCCIGDRYRATVGLLYQRPNQSASSSNLTGMMGIEFVAPGKTTFGFDYIIDDIAAGSMFGATIRQPITPDLTCQVGLGNGSRYFIGLTMKFGGK